jgi:hypothetical protein
LIAGRLKRAPRVIEAGLIVFWTRLLSIVLLLPIFAAGRFLHPLRDDALAAMDGRLGLTVPMVVARVGHHPWLGRMLERAYPSLNVLTLIAVILPLLCGKMRVAKEMLVSSIAALLITAAVFAVLPAVGPWVSHPLLTADAAQVLCGRTIGMLRHDGPLILNTKYSGIVCFPSFHVILAVLSAVSAGRCWPP